ncbi:hypothetical protein BKA65DRAFT_593551 [Rhexocercosporidium sp. MPI-PUGE-AT-0058]|nr:hypothetical protein BKA65DRAFT_593551 [Rhexocercosporidium sp. MPI-PUGE-AT-0058]
MARANIKVMQLSLAILALSLTFTSASPIKTSSEHSSHEVHTGSALHLQLPGRGHVFGDLAARVTSPPPPPPPPVIDNCGVIYIARDGKVTKTSPSVCPTKPAIRVRETKAVAEYDPGGEGGFYIARTFAVEPNFGPVEAAASSIGNSPLLTPTTTQAASYVENSGRNFPRQINSLLISSRPLSYIARDDTVPQEQFPQNSSESIRDNIDPRQTAPPGGGPWQGGNGGVIYIARDEDHKDHPPEPPQQTGGDGGIWIARQRHHYPTLPDGDPTGCIIYIARSSRHTLDTPPPGCPTPTTASMRVHSHSRLPQGARSYNLRAKDNVLSSIKQAIEYSENHIEQHPTITGELRDVKRRMIRDADEMMLQHSNAKHEVEHKPTFSTLFSPVMTTLTVSAETSRETGGIVIINGPQSEKHHNKPHSSKTKSTVLPGTFTVTGGSGTFTVIATHPIKSEHKHVFGRIFPPKWLSTHSTTHIRPTGKPTPSEWLSTHTRTHTHVSTKNQVRPTDQTVKCGISTSAIDKTQFHTMNKHTFSWKHMTITPIENPTHVRPTDKPVTWGFEARVDVTFTTPTRNSVLSPSCTLTVKPPTVTMMGNVKIVHASTTTVTQYHSCGVCLLEAPRTLDRRWEATKTVAGVETVTVDKCDDGRRRPTHGPITMKSV